VRDDPVRRQPFEHRSECGFGDRGLQDRHQHLGRQQGVAAEVGEEAPGAGRKILGRGQEGQHISVTWAIRGVGGEQVSHGKRRQGCVVGQCCHGDVDLALFAGDQDVLPCARHQPGSAFGDDAQLQVVLAFDRAAMEHQRPATRRLAIDLAGDFLRQHLAAAGDVVAQGADVGQHRGADFQAARVTAQVRARAAHAVLAHHPGQLRAWRQAEFGRLALALEPQAHAGIPRRESDDQARLIAAVGLQVHGDFAAAIEMVLDAGFVDVELEQLARGGARSGLDIRVRGRMRAAKTRRQRKRSHAPRQELPLRCVDGIGAAPFDGGGHDGCLFLQKSRKYKCKKSRPAVPGRIVAAGTIRMSWSGLPGCCGPGSNAQRSNFRPAR
jgi:hypothetical protein